MARPSRKKLAAALKELGYGDYKNNDYKKFDNEVYGKDARIYLWNICGNSSEASPNMAALERRRALENALEARGFDVGRSYGEGAGKEGERKLYPSYYGTVEVGVSYFKGWHWDE